MDNLRPKEALAAAVLAALTACGGGEAEDPVASAAWVEVLQLPSLAGPGVVCTGAVEVASPTLVTFEVEARVWGDVVAYGVEHNLEGVMWGASSGVAMKGEWLRFCVGVSGIGGIEAGGTVTARGEECFTDSCVEGVERVGEWERVEEAE